MNNPTFQESLNAAIVNHAYKFTDLHDRYHRRAIGRMGSMTRSKMDCSSHRVYTSEEEGLVWVVLVDFTTEKADIPNMERYAEVIYDYTGITWIRVAHEGKGWNLKRDPNTWRVED